MKRNRIRRRLTDHVRLSLPAGQVQPYPAAGEQSEHQNVSLDDEVLYHLSSLLDSVKTAIISLDGEGRIRVFNAVAESLFGLSRQAVLGKPFSGVSAQFPGRSAPVRALWDRLSDAAWAAGAALDLEYDLSVPQGGKRVFSYSVYPLGRLAWSVGNGVVIMLEDVTRRKEMEEQISDARKRLQEVFDGITDGIQVIDAQFRVTAFNKSMTSLVGHAVRVGQRCYKGCSFNSAVCDDCPAVKTFHAGQPASITKRMLRTAPEAAGERILEISTFPLLDRGNRVVQVVEYIKDVTERVGLADRLEHARRLAEIGEMAARVAHEVRNPLNAITGAAHFLATEFSGDELIQKFTSLIKRQSHRVDQVASDILNAARPLKLNRTKVNIRTVVEQALAAVSEQAGEQGIAVHSRVTESIPPVLADELQIEQALCNLLRNAVEAMPRGGSLTVGAVYLNTDELVEISVEDTGSGIAPEDRDRIFNAFFTTKPQGTGLGLSIVEGVLKNHGGDIRIEQPQGGPGTLVILSLPTRPQASVFGKAGRAVHHRRTGSHRAGSI